MATIEKILAPARDSDNVLIPGVFETSAFDICPGQAYFDPQSGDVVMGFATEWTLDTNVSPWTLVVRSPFGDITYEPPASYTPRCGSVWTRATERPEDCKFPPCVCVGAFCGDVGLKYIPFACGDFCETLPRCYTLDLGQFAGVRFYTSGRPPIFNDPNPVVTVDWNSFDPAHNCDSVSTVGEFDETVICFRNSQYGVLVLDGTQADSAAARSLLYSGQRCHKTPDTNSFNTSLELIDALPTPAFTGHPLAGFGAVHAIECTGSAAYSMAIDFTISSGWSKYGSRLIQTMQYRNPTINGNPDPDKLCLADPIVLTNAGFNTAFNRISSDADNWPETITLTPVL